VKKPAEMTSVRQAAGAGVASTAPVRVRNVRCASSKNEAVAKMTQVCVLMCPGRPCLKAAALL
jgi:hypothetical protein